MIRSAERGGFAATTRTTTEPQHRYAFASALTEAIATLVAVTNPVPCRRGSCRIADASPSGFQHAGMGNQVSTTAENTVGLLRPRRPISSPLETAWVDARKAPMLWR